MYSNNRTLKQFVPSHRRCKARRRKQQILVSAIMLILCSIISLATVAYIFTQTDSVENVFGKGTVGCEVEETFDGGPTKENVSIKNTGTAESYIRAMVVITWMSEDGKTVTASVPKEGTDYSIDYTDDENSGWIQSSDGFWYYTSPVASGTSTNLLINTCSLLDTANVPDGFYLSVEIVASAIQSTPTSVITEQWNSGVSSVNGTTLEIKK